MQRRTFVTAAAATLAAPMLHAQTLPSGPVRIVVGFPPGGGTDALARVVGQKLATMWNLSVVIENKAGAAGVIAADYVSKQPGDGNTLLMAHINSHALAPAMGLKLNYNAEKDFVPISMVGVTPMLLICNPDQPAKTVKDLVALCKANPGKISFASAGGGSAQHFALEMFKLRAQIFALHVPYRGSAPALTDLIGGQVNYCFETMTSATPFVKSGKVVALAQTRLKRAKSYPNVPTMAESGFPGFEATVWYGLMGPGKMPPAMAQRMNEDVNKVLAMPDVQEKMEQYGAEDGGGSIEKFASFIKDEQQKWAQVAKAANV
ncbi:MAG TPA: tripartite tricarboxylate transporter substrate binding protein, partial [Burkholderiaceae bacterium]|nr:tripartite tricarboxylate transporter substrate binding protein [Burkholderiaceae bacterium]